MRISSCLLIGFLVFRTGLSQTDKYTDENRPYKFGFNIEGYQHRQEEKDEKGLIKGEYGFITADGYYRVTVYATDENGDFRIISMKNYYVGFPPEDPQTTPQPATQYGPGRQPSGRGGSQPAAVPVSAPAGGQADQGGRRGLDPVQLTGLTACSDCLIPTTKKPGVGTRFGGGTGFGGGGGGGGGTAFGGRPQSGGETGFGGSSGGGGSGFGTQGGTTGFGNQGGFGGSGGGGGSGESREPQGGLRRPGGQQSGFGGPGGQQGGFGGPGGQQGGFGGPQGGRGTPAGGRFPASAGGSRDPTGGRGTGEAPPGGRRPQVGTVRDGLPPGVSMDDIKALLYTFNYTVGFHGHHEDGYRNGDKEGDYFFDGRDGVERKVEYIANEFGYQPNITFVDLPENDVRRPKEETEKEYGLKGYEFKWFYRK